MVHKHIEAGPVAKGKPPSMMAGFRVAGSPSKHLGQLSTIVGRWWERGHHLWGWSTSQLVFGVHSDMRIPKSIRAPPPM